MNRTIFELICNNDLSLLQACEQLKKTCIRTVVVDYLSLACACGHLQIAQWIYGTFNVTYFEVTTSYDCTQPLAQVCAEGQLAAAKWLHNTFGFMPSYVQSSVALNGACANGHLPVARWLHKAFGATKTYFSTSHDRKTTQWMYVVLDKNKRFYWYRKLHHTWYWQAEVIVMAGAISGVLLADVLRRL